VLLVEFLLAAGAFHGVEFVRLLRILHVELVPQAIVTVLVGATAHVVVGDLEGDVVFSLLEGEHDGLAEEELFIEFLREELAGPIIYFFT